MKRHTHRIPSQCANGCPPIAYAPVSALCLHTAAHQVECTPKYSTPAWLPLAIRYILQHQGNNAEIHRLPHYVASVCRLGCLCWFVTQASQPLPLRSLASQHVLKAGTAHWPRSVQLKVTVLSKSACRPVPLHPLVLSPALACRHSLRVQTLQRNQSACSRKNDLLRIMRFGAQQRLRAWASQLPCHRYLSASQTVPHELVVTSTAASCPVLQRLPGIMPSNPYTCSPPVATSPLPAFLLTLYHLTHCHRHRRSYHSTLLAFATTSGPRSAAALM